jgi:hypothetical protein
LQFKYLVAKRVRTLGNGDEIASCRAPMGSNVDSEDKDAEPDYDGVKIENPFE